MHWTFNHALSIFTHQDHIFVRRSKWVHIIREDVTQTLDSDLPCYLLSDSASNTRFGSKQMSTKYKATSHNHSVAKSNHFILELHFNTTQKYT